MGYDSFSGTSRDKRINKIVQGSVNPKPKTKAKAKAKAKAVARPEGAEQRAASRAEKIARQQADDRARIAAMNK
jgi:hypothetical protein